MHNTAYNFVKRVVEECGPFESVVEFGGLDVNETAFGLSIRALFNTDDYHAIDLRPGPGVHEVADCADWRTDRLRDVVVCCEVFEHTPRWIEILDSAAYALNPGGIFIMTCAAPDRVPHGAVTDVVQPGEYYENVNPDDIWRCALHHFEILELNHLKEVGDLQLVAQKL